MAVNGAPDDAATGQMIIGIWHRTAESADSRSPNDRISPVFRAVVQATEEAIVNAMVAAETRTGVNSNTIHALPYDRRRDALGKCNRLTEITK